MPEKKTTAPSRKKQAVAAEIIEEPKKATPTVVAEPYNPEQGKDLSIAGFGVAVASIFTNIFTFGLMAPVGLVLSIIGRVQSSKAGKPNVLALAGIIISGIVMALTLMMFVFFVVLALFSGSDGGRHTVPLEREWQDSDSRQQDSDNRGTLYNLPEFPS